MPNAGQDEDVHLGVAEEPEHVLPQDGVATQRGLEEPAAVVPVDEQHHQAGGDHRDGEQQQHAGDQLAQQNMGIRSSVMPGARILKIVPRKLMAPSSELDAREDQAQDQQVDARLGRPRGERRVQVQPVGAPPNRNDISMSIAPPRKHPERQRVDARERHVRGADLERHDVVARAR